MAYGLCTSVTPHETIYLIASAAFTLFNSLILYFSAEHSTKLTIKKVPVGIAATIVSAYLLYSAGLFAECFLNGYYLAMSFYGWWYWIKKKDLPPVKPSYCNKQEWWIVISIVMIGLALLAFLLKRFTASTVPVWDAWVSATAWAGMWLLAKRKIENWVLLNISNAFEVPLLLYKQLTLFAGLTLFLFIIAIQGYYQWRKIIRQDVRETLQPGA